MSNHFLPAESTQMVVGVLRASDSGQPLEPPIRARFERRLGVPLDDVRIHTDAFASRVASSLGAVAVTCRENIFFSDGQYRPDTKQGLWLLAHEAAHVIQQRIGSVPSGTPRGGPFVGTADDPWEQEANAVADSIVHGAPTTTAFTNLEQSAVEQEPTRVAFQCHDSFEHRALGDVPTHDLRAITSQDPRRKEVLTREIDLMWLWHQAPERVTEEDIRKICPWIQILRLPESDLIVTYGELNALPDYLPNAGTADTVSRDVLLPILQFIRQESYLRLNKLLNKNVNDAFAGAVYSPWRLAPGLLNTLLSTQKLDVLTAELGIQRVDHYQALLARNACHFAPFSWYRWHSAHVVARSLAARAFAAGSDEEKRHLTHQAWVHHGYGDHFLQDSFAAGHLVNKTLIMQWFVEWAADHRLVPVINWDAVKNMSTAQQPGIAGRELYDATYPGPSNDPQTAEERDTFLERLEATGLVMDDQPRDGVYQDYLSFLSSVITQSSSAAIHDYYNAHSLWVASPVHPEPYEVWGDDTLLSGNNGVDGVVQTSEAAQLSQTSVRELLANGHTEITTEQIREHFPNQVRTDSTILSLEAWNDTQKQFCGQKIFPALHDVVIRMSSPLITNISRDQDLTPRWSSSLPQAGYTKTTVLPQAGRLFAASSGRLYELDPGTGKVAHSALLTSEVGVGDYDMRLAADAQRLYVGAHGYVYGLDMTDLARPHWAAGLPQAGYFNVDVHTAEGRVFAASNGCVYELEPSTGAIRRSVRLARAIAGDYTGLLATVGDTLVIGSHGWVYAVDARDITTTIWQSSLPNTGYHRVDLAVHGNRLYAGSNGRVFELDASSGSIIHSLLVTDEVGVGDYTTTLAPQQDSLLAGTHGYVYKIALHDWSRPRWSASLAGNRYSMVNIAASADQIIAGSYGYLFRIDPDDGKVLRSTLLTLASGVGDFETRVLLDSAGAHCYASVHGYAYHISSERH